MIIIQLYQEDNPTVDVQKLEMYEPFLKVFKKLSSKTGSSKNVTSKQIELK